MQIDVTDTVHLTEFLPTDEAACLEHLADRDVYQTTLRIPHPYSRADFKTWMIVVEATADRYGEPVNWAIRQTDGRLIGGFGLDDLEPGHRTAIGYWLARPHWGQGIMSAVVGRACEYAFERWDLVRIYAHVYTDNPASARVLQKNGFDREGLLRKHYLKDGQFRDGWVYARVE
jgi:RimJ/RimL family protein N-acetyltransferase